MRADDVPEIRALGLFRGMADAAFEALIRAAYLQSFPPGFELIREGERADFLHILVEGGVELFAGWNNHETTLAALAPVSTFILAATIIDRPNLMSARTIGKSRVALIPSEDVRRAFAADRAFAEAIVHELAARFRDSVRHAKNVKLRTSVERLANYLIREHDAGGGGSFVLPHEKRLIATLLGMTPENLSRAFAALRPCGVQVEGAQVWLTDASALRELAQPTPLIDGTDG